MKVYRYIVTTFNISFFCYMILACALMEPDETVENWGPFPNFIAKTFPIFCIILFCGLTTKVYILLMMLRDENKKLG